MRNILIFLLSLFFVWSCQDLNPINPPDEFNYRNHFGEYIDTTFTTQKALFKVEYYLNTANAPKLSLGKFENFEASFLIRFTNLPDIKTSIDSVYLRFYHSGYFGDSNDSLKVGVFEVSNSWEESANKDEFWHNQTPSDPLDVLSLKHDSTGFFVIPLDTALVNKWRISSDNNNGLFFKMLDTDNKFIYELYSFEAANPLQWPRMYYKYQKDTLFVKDSTNIGEDATLFDYKANISENIFTLADSQKALLIASGIPVRTFIRFDDLYKLPKNAIIQGANLLLTVKDVSLTSEGQKNLLSNPNHSSDYYVHSISEADSNLTTYKIDSSFVTNANYLFSLIESHGQIRFNSEFEQTKFGKNLIQNVINGSIQSEWFYIRYKNEVQDISVKRLAAATEQSIKLNVRYYRIDQSGL